MKECYLSYLPWLQDNLCLDLQRPLARLEKKRISKGGDPEESPLPAMRKYHADKKKKAAKKK